MDIFQVNVNIDCVQWVLMVMVEDWIAINKLQNSEEVGEINY